LIYFVGLIEEEPEWAVFEPKRNRGLFAIVIVSLSPFAFRL